MKFRKILKQSSAAFLVSNIVFVITFIGNILLVRMLLPEDFGSVALAASMVGIIEIFTTFAFNTVLIQQRESASLARSILQLAVMAILLKLLLAVLFYVIVEPAYIAMIWSLFALIMASKLFSGVGPLLVSRLEKRGDFFPATLITSGSTLIAVIIAVAAVYLNAGVYGLLLREVLPPVFVFLLVVAIYPELVPRDIRAINRRQLRVAASASMRLYFQRGAELTFARLPNLLIESFFGAAILGLYAQATYLVTLVNRVMGIINQQVATVFFSNNRRNLSETSRGFLWMLALNLTISLPVMILLGLFPRRIVLFLWDEQWLGVVPFLQVMAVMVGLLPLFSLLKSRLLGLRRNNSITLIYCIGFLFIGTSLIMVRANPEPSRWVAISTVAAYGLMVIMSSIAVWYFAKQAALRKGGLGSKKVISIDG